MRLCHITQPVDIPLAQLPILPTDRVWLLVAPLS